MLGKRGAVGTFVLAAGLVIAPVSGSPAAADTTTGTSAQRNPPATVALLSPAPGNVAGSVALKAVGTIAGAQNDAGQQLEFWIDGGLASVAGCSLPSCSATYSWNTNGHGGAHTVQVQFLLRNEVVATTPVENFQVVRPTRITVNFPNPATAGTATSTTGRVVATDTNAGAAGAPVKVTFTPVTGSPTTVATTTAADGTFRVSYTARSNTTITAAVVGSNLWQANATAMSTLLQLTPVVSCSLTRATVQHGKSDTLTCRAPAMPSGTRATVQYRVSGRKWAVLTSNVQFSGGKAKYTFTLKEKGGYTVAMLIDNNSIYIGGYGQAHLKVT